MLKNRVLIALLVLGFFLPACGPAQIVPPSDMPQPLPSPTASWQVTFSQSGGFAGVQLSIEVASDGRMSAEDQRSGKRVTKQLDSATLEKMSSVVSSVAASSSQSPHSACADCFLYDLQVASGGRTNRVQVDDTTLAASGAQELIALLQQVRDDALKSQP